MSNSMDRLTDSAMEPEGISSVLETRRGVLPNVCLVLAVCLVCTLWIAFPPFTRAFFHAEVSYNEGWNVYNAERVAAHQVLYPSTVGWTTVNYPMLSFFSAAMLHRVTHEYLLSARILSLVSLVLCCMLVALIVERLGGSRSAAVLAAAFCLAVFCAAGDSTGYIGADDPQIFAQVFYLGAMYVYLLCNRRGVGLVAVAALLVVGGCIKQNLLEFPLAVLVDLLLVSRRRALLFLASGATFSVFAVIVQQRCGGPGFVTCILAPRAYAVTKVLQLVAVDLAPLAFPLGLALYIAWRLARRSELRLAVLLFGFSLVVGSYFSGGDGVSVNTFFGVFLSMSVMLGLGLSHLQLSARGAVLLPLALWGWLMIPWLVVPPLEEGRKVFAVWDPPLYLQQMEDRQERFNSKLATIESQQGPALCESLLLCASAEKPYVYDPFNATRFIGLGKLRSEPVVEAIHEHRFSSIQLNGPLDDPDRFAHFAPAIVKAIGQEYRPLMQDQDGVVMIPARTQRVNDAGSDSRAATPSYESALSAGP